MALVDRDRIVVAVNDAALAPFGYDRDEVIGMVAGSTRFQHDQPLGDGLWEQLLRTNEVYAEDVVTHRTGKPIRVNYAVHGTTINGGWHALIVTLSARFEPDGVELIGAAEAEWPGRGSKLTPRERDVVRRLALGAGTRQIAADLFLSPATVRSHVRNAMVKTNAHTRAQLVAIVLGEGLGAG